jgi:hypothetical protein
MWQDTQKQIRQGDDGLKDRRGTLYERYYDEAYKEAYVVHILKDDKLDMPKQK